MTTKSSTADLASAYAFVQSFLFLVDLSNFSAFLGSFQKSEARVSSSSAAINLSF